MRDSSSHIVQDASLNGLKKFPNRNNNDLQLLENLFDNLTIGLYRTSVDGEILYANDAIVKLLGFESLEDLQIRNLENHGYGGRTSRDSFKKIMEANGEVIGLESCWKRKDGSEIFVSENARAIKNNKGDIIFFEGSVEDITERKKVEKALKSQIDFNSKLIHHSPVFFVAINAQGKTIMMNETMLSATGYKKIEVIQQDYLEIFVPEREHQMLSKVFEQIVNDRENTLNENHILTKDKRELLVEWHGTPMFKDDGAFDFFIGLGINITERKNAEEALRKNEERYKNLFNNATVGIYRSTTDGQLLLANPALLAIYGYSSFEELTGINTSEVYFDSTERERFKKIIESEGTIYGYETKGKKADGSVFYFLDSARAIKDKNGKIVYYEGVIQDITEQKKAEEAIQNQNKFLNNIFESLTHPFYVINASDYKMVMGNKISGFDMSSESPSCYGITHHRDKPCNGESDICPLEIVKKTKEPVTIEHVHFDESGDEIIVEVHGYPIFNSDGNVVQMIEYCLDITERKKVEKELLDIQYKLSTLLNNVPVGVYRSTPDGQVLSTNPSLIHMLGYDTAEEYKSIPADKSYLNKERRIEFIEELNRNGEVKNFESQMIRRDGTIIWVSANATATKDDSGNILHIDGMEEDITDRKKAELLSNAVYRISEASDAVQSLGELYNAVHKIIDSVLYAKNFFIALYSEEKDLLTFPYFVDEIDNPPGSIKAGRGYTAYVLRTGKPVFYSEELDKQLKAKGEVETVGTDSPSWIGVPLIVNNKTIGAMVVQHYTDPNAYDESDLHLLEYVSSQIAKAIVTKRAEEELLKLSSAVKQSSASIIITDLDGKIEYVNPKFSELTGFTPEEVYGKKTNIFKSGETPAEVYKNLWETVTGGSEWKGEFRNKKKSGELYWESASISPIKNAEGKITHFLAVKEDITERKRIQKELIVSKEKAEEMNRLKSIFLANMSHELRTPLVGILGYAEILQSDSLNDEQTEMVGTILYSGKRLMNTLNAILELTKLDAEKSELKLSPVILKFIIQEIAELFKIEAAKKDVEIICRFEDENPVSLLDENLFREAIEHLVSNAVKYTKKGKVEIVLRSDISTNQSVIEIIDSGIGISEEHQKVIFEEFRQVSEGLNRQYEGTGLGLTLTKRFIELMYGNITLESKIDKGSKFTVTFPLAKISPENELTFN